jgi:pyruvate kinase
MMARIAEDAASGFPFERWTLRAPEPGVPDLPGAIADAACTLAQDIGAAAIVACTTAGSTARWIARHRPSQPILALPPLPQTCRRLSLIWGVVPVLTGVPGSTDEAMEHVPSIVRKTGLVRPGDRIVITAGIPMGVSGSTNSIRAVVA